MQLRNLDATGIPFPTKMEQTETAEPRPARRRQSSRRMSEESNGLRFVRRHSTSSSHTITARQRRNSRDITFEDDTGVMSLSESSWWNESPLLVAVLPCLGAFIFGTEYIQDIILFVCVCWYLHTCIHLPWSLYELSRPRKIPPQVVSNMTPAQQSAQRTLSYYSIFLLIFALVSPFAGLFLIRAILESVGAYDGGPYVTYFHAALFVLFGGVRPLNHLASLVAGGTRELQGRVHYAVSATAIADEEAEELREKVERMEDLLSMAMEKLHKIEHTKAEREVRKEKGMLDVQDTFEKTAARLEDGARRREKKMEIGMEMMERRLDGLGKTCESLSGMVRDLEKEKLGGVVDADPLRPHGLRGLILALLDWVESIWLTLTFRRRTAYRSRTRSSTNGNAFGYGAPARARKNISNGNGVISSNRTNGNSSASGSASGLTSISRRRSYDAPLLNLDTVLEEEAPGVDIDMELLGGGQASGDVVIIDNLPGTSAAGAIGMRHRGGRMAGALDAYSMSTHSPL